MTFNSTQSCPCDIALKRINCPIVGKLEEVRPMQKIQKRTERRTFWCGKAPGVPEFSTLKKFWQKTLKRWSNVTCVQEWDTLTCLERKYKEKNIRKKQEKYGTHWHV